MALKNLGAIFGKEGDSLKALYYLRRSFEVDPLNPQTVYGSPSLTWNWKTSSKHKNISRRCHGLHSGITPYSGKEASGPTEKFIQNFCPRVNHIAFQTEEIEETTRPLLLDLVGSPKEGLKQTIQCERSHGCH